MNGMRTTTLRGWNSWPIAFLCLAIAGCGGGGVATSGGGGASSETKLSKSTLALSQNGGSAILAQTPSSVTIGGNHPEIKPGTVLVSTEGHGLIRKAASVSVAGGNTVVQTGPAQLAEAFDEVHVKSHPKFNQASIGDIKSNRPGLSFKWVSANGNAPAKGSPRDVEFNKLEIDFAGLSVTSAQGISVDGSATFTGDPELELDIDRAPGDYLPSVHHFKAAYSCELHGSMTISSKFGGSVGYKETLFDEYVGEPILAGYLLFIPRLKIETALTGTAAGKIVHTQGVDMQAAASLDYERDSGWSSDKTLNPQMAGTESDVEAEFGITAQPVVVTLSYELYGMAGPYIQISGESKAQGTHMVQNGVEGINAEIDAGIAGELGIVAEEPAFVEELFSGSWTPIDVPIDSGMFKIFEHFFPFTGTSSITVGDNGPAPDDVFAVSVDGTSLGQTDKGGTGQFRVTSLSPGQHTLTITCLDDGANGADIGTLGISLSNGFTFADGSTELSDLLELNQTKDYTIIVPPPSAPRNNTPAKPLPRSKVKAEHPKK